MIVHPISFVNGLDCKIMRPSQRPFSQEKSAYRVRAHLVKNRRLPAQSSSAFHASRFYQKQCANPARSPSVYRKRALLHQCLHSRLLRMPCTSPAFHGSKFYPKQCASPAAPHEVHQVTASRHSCLSVYTPASCECPVQVPLFMQAGSIPSNVQAPPPRIKHLRPHSCNVIFVLNTRPGSIRQPP